MVCFGQNGDDEKDPPRDSQDGPEKDEELSPEEEGVDSANDTFKKFLKQSEED